MVFNKRNPMSDMEMTGMASESPSKGKAFSMIIMILVIIILALFAWLGFKLLTADSIAKVSGRDWQAVFLSNGQVYFGKVKSVGFKTLTLSDIYYLQVVTKPLQRTEEGGTGSTASQQTQQELTLIKLGNEIHGPTDSMLINRDQILLTEQLKSDSRVVTTITKYVDDQKAAAAKK